ncbi:biorientation of chromosomes in cell division protein 1-like 1 isoform X1 [Diorhabda carinulata]|uniref:biorientation of chromosomes in cell division protein 1-like 1 isoform X1 n=1 Tax=Diorhabda carinulata TaxID=1163345 RepID=UPI0025A02FB4|nr:biorientation of chromosomes in cell division protein 1-like 1 isoform X1 [Diorhabda carinulata]
MEVMCNNYIPGDSRLIEKLVSELKSQGIFDQFRKECISDVDTKPAYQNLKQRVEGSVNTFLKQQTWSIDLNKNQLREQLRKNLLESGYLETGVERIVDQVVNPKINTVFLPKVEEIVYRFLGVDKPVRNVKKEVNVSITDLLPTDLEAVSPESVHSFKNESKKEDKLNSLSSSIKLEEDESPPFEPLNENEENNTANDDKMIVDENTRDSHLSGFSGLESHGSNPANKCYQMELEYQNSLESHLSIFTSGETSKMEVCEDSIIDANVEKSEVNETYYNLTTDSIENTNEKDTEKKYVKGEEKGSKSTEKSSKEKKDDKHRKSSSSNKDKEKSSKSSQSKYKEYKEKDKKNLKSGSSKDRDNNREKVDKDKEKSDKEKSSKKPDKEKYKSDKEKDKVKCDKSKTEKETVNKMEKEKVDKERSRERSDKRTKSDNDKNKHDKDKSIRDKDKNTKDNKYKEKSKIKEKSEKSSKDRSSRDKPSSSKESKEKDYNKEYKDKNKEEKNKSSSSSSKHSSSKEKDKKPKTDSNSQSTSKSSSDSKSKINTDKTKKEETSDKHGNNKKETQKDTRKKSKDDHYSSKLNKSDRRSTDRDSNDGKSSSKNNFTTYSESSRSENNSQDCTSSSFTGGSGDSSNSDKVEGNREEIITETPKVKYIKPKFALNFEEARKIMKIRKQLAILEKQNKLSLAKIELPFEKIKAVNDNEKVDISEEKENINGSKLDSGGTSLVSSIEGTNLSKENWEALEAKLEQVMAFVNSNSYDSDEDFEFRGYSSVDNIPKHLIDLSANLVKKTEKEMMNKQIAHDKSESDRIQFSVVFNSLNENDCYYLEKPTQQEENNLKFIREIARNLEKEIGYSFRDYSGKILRKTGMKRKFEEIDAKNNNKTDYTKTEKKRRISASSQSVVRVANKKNSTDVTPTEVFPLPLSPAESDKSNERKDEDLLIPMKQKRIVRGYSQRYSSDDLYKPRPTVGRNNFTRRNI